MSPALIANISGGANIRQFLRYDLMGPSRYAPRRNAELLASSVPSVDPERIAKEFDRVLAGHRPVAKPIYRVSLSLQSGVTLTQDAWREVAERWMQAMGMGGEKENGKGDLSDFHYVICRHRDTDHEHVHLSILRVRLASTERGPNGGGGLWSAPRFRLEESTTSLSIGQSGSRAGCPISQHCAAGERGARPQ